jgi:hypothetical protein
MDLLLLPFCAARLHNNEARSGVGSELVVMHLVVTMLIRSRSLCNPCVLTEVQTWQRTLPFRACGMEGPTVFAV